LEYLRNQDASLENRKILVEVFSSMGDTFRHSKCLKDAEDSYSAAQEVFIQHEDQFRQSKDMKAMIVVIDENLAALNIMKKNFPTAKLCLQHSISYLESLHAAEHPAKLALPYMTFAYTSFQSYNVLILLF
jgi:hypothetical protein